MSYNDFMKTSGLIISVAGILMASYSKNWIALSGFVMAFSSILSKE